MKTISAVLASTCILMFTSAEAKCVHDTAGNESTCGHEARITVAKRHGFSDISHGEMDNTISQNNKMRNEWQKAYDHCKKIHNFCE